MPKLPSPRIATAGSQCYRIVTVSKLQMASDSITFKTEMMGATTLADLPENEALKRLAAFIDAAEDNANKAELEHALALAKTIRPNCSDTADAELNYFEGNIWSLLRKEAQKAGQDPWTWNSQENECEIISLRRALSSSGYRQLELGRRLQILTNLGNAMSRLGRTVEAIQYFDRAISSATFSSTSVADAIASTTCSPCRLQFEVASPSLIKADSSAEGSVGVFSKCCKSANSTRFASSSIDQAVSQWPQ